MYSAIHYNIPYYIPARSAYMVIWALFTGNIDLSLGIAATHCAEDL